MLVLLISLKTFSIFDPSRGRVEVRAGCCVNVEESLARSIIASGSARLAEPPSPPKAKIEERETPLPTPTPTETPSKPMKPRKESLDGG
jgi:hypothetical protein